jgi:CRP-like cAMP-binding protein
MPRKDIPPQALLAALPLFKSMDEAALGRLAAASVRRALAKGDVLFRRGDPPEGMYVVVHGQVQLMATRARRDRLTGVIGRGRSFGEPVMFLERPALVDAVAATDALVLLVPKSVVFAEIDRNPRFARLLLAHLSQRIETLVNELERQSAGGGRARLVAYLLRHAGEGRGERVITLPTTKAAIASHLRLTPEHFSRLLHELAAGGVLAVDRRRIVVPDLARLAALGGEDAEDG